MSLMNCTCSTTVYENQCTAHNTPADPQEEQALKDPEKRTFARSLRQ